MEANISLEFPTDIVYVAGIVNGVEKVFIQDTYYPVIWTACVEVSDNDEYEIYLQAYDKAGNVSEYKDTITFLIPHFIYDRKQSDVDRVRKLAAIGWSNMTDEERDEWNLGMKGALNISDIRRINNNCMVLADLLKIELPVSMKSIPNYPDTVYFSGLLLNLKTLYETGHIYSDTPKVPAAPINTFSKLNDVEKILHDIYKNFNDSYYYFAGDSLISGQEIADVL